VTTLHLARQQASHWLSVACFKGWLKYRAEGSELAIERWLAAEQRLPQNLMLAKLPESQLSALTKFLVPVDLPLGMRLSEPNQAIEFAYFPLTGLVSTDALTSSGESVEVGVIGREGFAGIAGVLGHVQMQHSVQVQGSGTGLRLRMSILREEFLKGGVLAQLVYDFLYLQTVQISQSVLCNRLHPVEARLARWLLTSADRSESEQLMLTQEFLAQMLGSRRSTVTVAAGEMQRQGMIDYKRGKIRISNRPALESVSCECYQIVKTAYDRVHLKS
jgi:CRP-like cAMP-binding protein